MGERYFIPGLATYMKHLDERSKSLIVQEEENVILIQTDEDKQKLINSIANYDFVRDQELTDFLKKHLPYMPKSFPQAPFQREELKQMLNTIFSDLPDDIFEETDIVKVLTKVINHVLRKSEATFVTINITNGKLIMDPACKVKKIYTFHYHMIKCIHNLETRLSALLAAQHVIRRIYAHHVLFNNEKLSKAELETMNHMFNLNGDQLSAFQYQLNMVVHEIHQNKVFLKRTGVPVPRGYFDEEKELTECIDKASIAVNENISKTLDIKTQINEQLRKHKGVLTVENIRLIVDLLKSFTFRGFR